MIGLDFTNIILKLTDLCKCTQRIHGSMFFEVSAPCKLMILYDFLVMFHVSFCLVLGLILEAVLARFGIYFWSSRGAEVSRIISRINTKISIEKNRFREGMSTKGPSGLVARRGVRDRRLGRKEEKTKRRKRER